MKKLCLLLPLGLLLLFPTSASAVLLQVNMQGEIEIYNDQILGEETDEDENEIEDDLKEVEVEVEGKAGEPAETPKPRMERKVAPTQNKSQEIRLRPRTKDETTIQIYEQQKRGELIKTPSDREEAELKEEMKADRVRLEFNDKKKSLREEKRKKEVELREVEEKSKEMNADDARELLYRENAESEVELEEARFEAETEGESRKIKIEDTVRGDKRQIRIESPDGSASRVIEGELILETDTNELRVATPGGNGRELLTFPDEVIQTIQDAFVLPENANAEIELEIEDDGVIKHRIRNVEQERRVFGVFKMKVKGDAVVDDATGEIEFESNEPNVLKRLFSVFSR